MKRIVFATGNKNKMVEIKAILQDLGLPILSMKEAGVCTEIVENGTTFEENALIKARAVALELPNDVILADDSGLEIDYLNKEPGIYSARYLGEETSYQIKNQALLDRLEGVPDEQRTGRFVCAVAAVLPGNKEIVVRGNFEGRIAHQPAGENGFGYDPIFWVPERNCTSAQLSMEDKNQMSHRGKALRMIHEKLEGMME